MFYPFFWYLPAYRRRYTSSLYRQPGAVIIRRGNFVERTGGRVKPREEAALRLVDGERLGRLWDDFEGDDEIKIHICRQIET